MRTSTCLLPKVQFLLVVSVALMACQAQWSYAQAPGDVITGSSQGSAGFFSRQFGTALRATYHTQGYGTQDDVFSIGGMKVFDLDEISTFFIDGQGTLSDDFGGGFNLGVGYRQLINSNLPILSLDPERIMGIGFWTDGQSTSSDNFFTQLGFSLESLGESFDTRLSGYFPLERSQVSDPVLTSFATPIFQGNNLFGATESFTVDTALTVIDSEVAKRLGDLDAWAYVGGYHLDGGPIDTQGYRAGVRGYAVPDLLLSLEVNDDNLFRTNVRFGITWFVGRTHRGNAPCGTILDRMREPVLRNDFIALTSASGTRVSGAALTQQGTTDAVDIVHFDSSAAPGGDGTFENPFNDLAAATALRDDAIVLAHGGSSAQGPITLRTNQSLLGEGLDANGVAVVHTVDTNELGIVNLPETAPGAQGLAQIRIDGLGGTAITMADGSSVNNFAIDNSSTGVIADGIAAPGGSLLANLEINDPTANGVLLRDTTGAVVVENTVAINRVAAGGEALFIDGGNAGVAVAATVNDSLGRSLAVRNRTGGTVDFTGLIDDDATVLGNNSEGIVVENNTDATVNLTGTLDVNVNGAMQAMLVNNNTNTTVNASGAVDLNASGAGDALGITGNDDASTITFADLNATATSVNDAVNIAGGGNVTISSADATRDISSTSFGSAFVNTGGPAGSNATVVVNSNITNTGGQFAVSVSNRTENDVTFNGTITDTSGIGSGISIANNSAGNIVVTNTATLSTGANNAVTLSGNSNPVVVSFNGLDINTTSGTGFSAVGGGTLGISSTGANTIDTVTGTGLNLVGMTIDAANVTFDSVNVANGSGQGINLTNLDGTGTVNVNGGTLTTAATAINVNNAMDVNLSNLTVNNTAGQAVNVTNQGAGSTAMFNTIVANTTTAAAVTVSGNIDGATTFTGLTANTTSGDGVTVSNNNSSTTTFNGMEITSTGSGRGFVASGSGTIAATGTNTVSTQTGTGVDIQNTTIDGAGVTFTQVEVDGATNGVILNGLTGGQVTIGSTATASTLNTTGDAILLTDAVDVNIDNVDVTTNLTGLVVNNSNNDDYNLAINDLTVSSVATRAVTIDQTADGTFTLALTNSVLANTNALPTVEIDATNAVTLNANIIGNTFTNNGAGDNLDIAANSNATTLNLSMTGNTTNGGTDSVVLRELPIIDPADFNIVDRDNLITNNPGVGTFIFESVVNDIADFDDIPALP